MMAKGEYGEFVKKKEKKSAAFGELLELYKKNYQDQVSYKTAKKFYMDRFREHFGEKTLLSSINYGHLKTYRNNLMKRLNQHGKPFTPSSINSEMSCLRQMIKEAFEYRMFERNPFNDGKTLRLKVSNERDRYLTPEEARKLYNVCPVHSIANSVSVSVDLVGYFKSSVCAFTFVTRNPLSLTGCSAHILCA